MKQSHRVPPLLNRHLLFGLSLVLANPWSASLAPAAAPITPSGLNTTVSAPITTPGGQTQFTITGGTRPGGGANLFHSFGTFDVPTNNIANFLNHSGLATSNILGRVTGGNLSNIFGTIQTTGFGNANLFLMNPAGFLFGPTATVNVGGIMTFTSADYLRLSDNARFNAAPRTGPDLLLSAAPVAAFGFLGSNPGAITVQGSQLSVTDGTGISLVGGNITVEAGTLTAPSGQITLVSVGKPSKSKVGGEVDVSSGFTPIGFKSLGTIRLSEGSTVDTSGAAGSGLAAGTVKIRGGEFLMDASALHARTPRGLQPGTITGNIEVTADHVALSNHSRVSAGTSETFGLPGNILFNANTFTATDSAISASVIDSSVPSGAVTIQGLKGSGTSADSVSLTNSTISTSNQGLPTFNSGRVDGGPIVIGANDIVLNQSHLGTSSHEGTGGPITLVSSGRVESHDSTLSTTSIFGSGGPVDVRAGTVVDLTGTIIDAHSSFGPNGAGTINMSAPFISMSGSKLHAWTGGIGPGGTIGITGRYAVSLTNGTFLDVDNVFNPPPPVIPPTTTANGGTISIDGGVFLISDQTTMSAQSTLGNGGTIDLGAKGIVSLNETLVTTEVSGGPQTVGGKIAVGASLVSVKNSQILSTATEGQGGTIEITSYNRRPVRNSVLDASSQSGTDGTVTIQRP